jgi:outer membrane protein, multidrug efflux system
MSSPRTMALTASILLLAGCAAGPADRPAPFPLAPRFREALADTTAPGVAPEQFWTSFRDSTLDRLIAQALGANRDLAVVVARVQGARAQRAAATMDFAPTVVVGGGYTRQRLAASSIPGFTGSLPDQDVWNADVGVSWELDLFGRTRRSVQVQSAFLGSAREDLRDAQVLLTAEVARAYFELRGAQERLATARQNAENQRRTLSLTVERLEAGRGNAFDTDRAQAQLSSTLSAIPAIEGVVAAIQHRLSVLTGRPPAEAVSASAGEALPPTFPASLEIVSPDSLIHQRPDVRSAERRLAARRALVGAAVAEYLPRVSLVGSAGYMAPTAGSLGEEGTSRYAVGPVISWSVLNVGRLQAGVDGARAGRDEAQARYDQAVLRALEEVETSLVTYRKARERLQHLDDAASASERAAELARVRFQEGAADFLQVLDAERTLLDAQDRRASGRTEANTTLVGVYRALGGAWPGAPRTE